MHRAAITTFGALLVLAAGAQADSITQTSEAVIRLGETLPQPRCASGTIPAILEAESPPAAPYGPRWSAVATLATDEIETWSALTNGPAVQEAIAAYATSDVLVPPERIRETILGMMRFERHDAPAWRFQAIGKPADDPDGTFWLPVETSPQPQVRVRYGCVAR